MPESIRIVPVGQRGAYSLEVADSERYWRVHHERYCIALITVGSGSWRYRGREDAWSPSALMLMEPGELHVATRVDEPGTFTALFISEQHIEQDLGNDGAARLHWARNASSSASAIQAMLRVQGLSRTGTPEEQDEAIAYALSAVLTDAAETPQARAKRRALGEMRRAASLLRDMYRAAPSQVIDIRQVANTLGRSYHWFIHSFAQEVGVSPYRYVQTLRVAKARQLLLAGPTSERRTMEDVAREAGFASRPHLNRDFTRAMGVAPGHFARSVDSAWGERATSRRATLAVADS